MKPVLFYDTETTGLPLFGQPSDHPGQARVVQFGARLVDVDTRKIINTLDLIIKPEGWEISDEAAAVHGITMEHAMDVGVSGSLALGLLLDLWECSVFRVGHNEQFDARMVRIEQCRHDESKLDQWKDGQAECTAALATPIMKLPPTPKMLAAKRNHPKTPNLGEAYEFFTGRKLQGAHSALVDVDACIDVWFAIRDGVREPVALAA